MTLKQLEAFYWAATCASFAVAAERLHITLSSLSKRINELEISLGRQLFDRSGHRAVTTEAGRQLLPRALALLGDAEQLRADVGMATGLSGICRFGVGELTAWTWLPKLVTEANRRHPNLHLAPHVDLGRDMERQLEEGILDFAIISGRSSRCGIASQTIAHAGFAWVGTQRVVGRSRSVTARLLAQTPLIALPAGAGTTRILDDWLAAQGIVGERRISCNNWGAVAGMLVEGSGIGFLPEGWARALIARGHLLPLASRPALAPLHYSFQWRRDDTRPLVATMKAIAVDTVDFARTTLF